MVGDDWGPDPRLSHATEFGQVDQSPGLFFPFGVGLSDDAILGDAMRNVSAIQFIRDRIQKLLELFRGEELGPLRDVG